MTPKMQRALWTGLVLTIAVSAAPLATAQTAGEQWEYQGTMEMMGMKMPMPPSKMCQKPDTAKTPTMQENCKVSDVQTKGNTTTFKVQCGPPQPMEGTATTTVTGDSLNATYKMKMPDGEMTYNLSGKKTGTCTP